MKKIVLFLIVFLLAGCNLGGEPSLSESKKTTETTTEPAATTTDSVNSTDPVSNTEPADDDTEECENNLEGWVITFCDEFDSTGSNPDLNGLDLDKWSYQLGTGSQYGLDGWGNDEEQFYLEDNVEVRDGKLMITAKKEQMGDKKFTSARIYTYGKFSQTYGRFEARIKLPAGDGFWPAFWMLPEDNIYGGWPKSGEIDIMEARGRLTGEISGAIHYGNDWPQNQYRAGSYQFPTNHNITQFHTYAVEWEEGLIKWYVDGQEYFRATESTWFTPNGDSPAPFNKDFHIILNLAIGGHFDGYLTPSDDLLPSTMEVDYVRVYMKEPDTN